MIHRNNSVTNRYNHKIELTASPNFTFFVPKAKNVTILYWWFSFKFWNSRWFFFSFTKGFSYTKGLFHRFDKYFSVSDTGGSLSQCIHEDSGYGSPAIVNFGIWSHLAPFTFIYFLGKFMDGPEIRVTSTMFDTKRGGTLKRIFLFE